VPDLANRGGRHGRPGGQGLGNILFRGAAGALTLRLAGTALAFGLQVLLARLLGLGRYGDYIYAFSLVTLLAVPLKLGLDVATVRFLPTYWIRSEWGLMRGLLRRTVQLQAASSLAGALLMLLVVWFVRRRLALDLFHTLLVAAPLLPLLTLQFLAEARLRALSRVTLSRIPQEIFQPLAVAALVYAGLLLGDGEVSAPAAMAYTLTATAAAVVLGFVLFRYVVPRNVSAAPPQHRTRHWMRTAVQLSLVASGFVVIAQIDVLLAGYFLGTTAAGAYSVASRISGLVPFGLTAVNLAVSPMIPTLWAEKRHAELQRLVTLAAAGILLTTLPVAVVCTVFGDPLLSLFGEEFAGAGVALVILVIGRTFSAFSGSTSLLLTMTGHQLLVAKVVGASAAIDILLHVVLVPRFGILGAATATTTTIVLWNVALVYFVFRRMRINPSVLSLLSRRTWHAKHRAS
jgi:O-antigen/teichoic acid export membrane protein